MSMLFGDGSREPAAYVSDMQLSERGAWYLVCAIPFNNASKHLVTDGEF